VVQNFRLRIPGLRTFAPWAVTRRTFYSAGSDDHAYPFAFGVAGRQSFDRFYDFMLRGPGLVLAAGLAWIWVGPAEPVPGSTSVVHSYSTRSG
jgi:hypothetical protein